MEKRLWMIYTTHMFVEIYLYIQVAIIPVIVREFQLTLIEASLIATVPSIAMLLMNIPSGFLADRFSPNQLLCASMLIEGVSAFAISQTTSFWALVAGVVVMKIASPIYHISGLSQISKLVQPKKVSRSIGFHNALGSLGSAIGLISLTVFLATTGWRWTYLVWSFPIIAWGIILLTSSELKIKPAKVQGNPKVGRISWFSSVFSPALLLFLAMIAIREIGATGTSTFMTTYFVDVRSLSDTTASLVFALGPFIGIVGALGGGFLSERLGAKKALDWVLLGCSVSLLALSLMEHLYLLTFMYLVYTLFSNALWSPMNTIIARVSSRANRGLSYSFYFFTEGLMDSIAPTIAAGVIAGFTIWSVFPFSISLIMTSLVVLQFLPRLEKRDIPSS